MFRMKPILMPKLCASIYYRAMPYFLGYGVWAIGTRFYYWSGSQKVQKLKQISVDQIPSSDYFKSSSGHKLNECIKYTGNNTNINNFLGWNSECNNAEHWTNPILEFLYFALIAGEPRLVWKKESQTPQMAQHRNKTLSQTRNEQTIQANAR